MAEVLLAWDCGVGRLYPTTVRSADPMSTSTFNSRPDTIPRFEAHPASAALQDAVDELWLMRLDSAPAHLVPRSFGSRPLVVLGPDGLLDGNAPGFPNEYRHQLVVPDGSLDILLHLPYRTSEDAPIPSDGSKAYATVLMPVRRTVDAAFHTPSLLFIIRFFPGGARDFLPRSVHTLGDRAIPLEELWGESAHDFANEAAEAVTIQALAATAEKHLLAHKRKSSESATIVRRSVLALQKSRGGLPLEELQKDSGLTERQLERIFKEYVGISPKRLARTLRLNFLVDAIRDFDRVDWHDLIVTLNYCDQPHLIREFRDFINMSPDSFRREMKRHIEQKQRIAEAQAAGRGSSESAS
jgi:AraC-like DNA-binding protein